MLSTFTTVLSLVLILNIKGIFATETTQCNELKEIVEEVKQTCDRRYKELEERFNAHVSRRSLAGGIAFSAELSTQLTQIKLGTTIKYEKVYVNDGSGYDKQTGVFTAPETGVYMLTYFIGHGNVPAQAWMCLKHNGQIINGAVVDTFHHNEDQQGGNMAIVRLNSGDRVWIEAIHTDNAYLDGCFGFTTFSGVYLYA